MFMGSHPGQAGPLLWCTSQASAVVHIPKCESASGRWPQEIVEHSGRIPRGFLVRLAFCECNVHPKEQPYRKLHFSIFAPPLLYW
jgi:hypothetical protein